MHYTIHTANVKATWKQACADGVQKQPGSTRQQRVDTQEC